MHSGTMLAALAWAFKPTEEHRRWIEIEAAQAAKGPAPLEAAAAELSAAQTVWVQAQTDFKAAYDKYAASKLEADRLSAQLSQLALESASLHHRAALTAHEFITAAVQG